MDLAEHPVQVVDVTEGVGREHQVDGVSPQECQVGQIALAQLDAHILPFAQPSGEGQLLGGEVDPDGGGALLGEGDRALGAPAAQLEHPFSLEVAEQPQLRFGGDFRAVVGTARGKLRPSLVRGGVPIPCRCVVTHPSVVGHTDILPRTEARSCSHPAGRRFWHIGRTRRVMGVQAL